MRYFPGMKTIEKGSIEIEALLTIETLICQPKNLNFPGSNLFI